MKAETTLTDHDWDPVGGIAVVYGRVRFTGVVGTYDFNVGYSLGDDGELHVEYLTIVGDLTGNCEIVQDRADMETAIVADESVAARAQYLLKHHA